MTTLSLNFTITSPPSTTLNFTPAAPFSGSGSAFTAVGPITSGVTVGTFSVVPAGWQGTLALSGAQAASFTLSGMSLVTAAVLGIGSVSAVTITANP